VSYFQPVPFGTPPFFPPILGPVPGTPGSPSIIPAPQGGVTQAIPPPPEVYSPGPYCFGIDKLLCEGLAGVLPGRIGMTATYQDLCKAVTNLLCILLVLAALAGIIYLGVYGLILGEEKRVIGG
jgi:hypothetical protein